MDEEISNKILHELFPHFEAMETRIDALMQFLKDKGIATDEQLAPYLEEAGKASYVKWLATRLRVEHFLSLLMKEAEKQMPPSTKEEAPRQIGKSPDVSEPARAEPSANEDQTAAGDEVKTKRSTESTAGLNVAADEGKKHKEAEPGEQVDADAA